MKKKTLMMALFSSLILLSCQNRTETSEEFAVAIDSAAIKVDSAAAITNNSWQYDQLIDKMTSKTTKFAYVMSRESLDLEFPYDGRNYGELTLRKKEGLDIYLKIDKGQITGGYDNKFIKVRFDEQDPITFSYSEPQDGSSNIIFINNELKFLSKLKKSNKVLISLPLYHAGNQILEFNTANLKW